MSEIQFSIQRERPPTRCEVCHQVDQFDPQTGICLRCESLSIPQEGSVQSPHPATANPQGTGWLQFLLIFFGFWGLMCGGFCSVIIPSNNPGFLYGLLFLTAGGLAIALAIRLWQRESRRNRETRPRPKVFEP